MLGKTGMSNDMGGLNSDVGSDCRRAVENKF